MSPTTSTEQQAAVSVSDPPESASSSEQAQAPSRDATSPQADSRAQAREFGSGTQDDQSLHDRQSSWRQRINPNTVIGGLIAVIGALIVLVLTVGINSLDSKFDAVSTRLLLVP